MVTSYRKAHPCTWCGVVIKPTGSGLYHCKNDDCPVAHFKVDPMGKVYDVTYCADVVGERV